MYIATVDGNLGNLFSLQILYIYIHTYIHTNKYVLRTSIQPKHHTYIHTNKYVLRNSIQPKHTCF